MTDNRISEVQTTQREPERERRIFTFKATQVVWLLFGILEVLLALRFVFGVRDGNHVEALAEPFTCGSLLGVSEKLIGLGSNLAPFVVGELITSCPLRAAASEWERRTDRNRR